ncbi:CRP-like cAMP-binding protein [Maribacter vaceletii]|uniref:CRP-like cAMP-binding protein n=1 Tax=Maribacter vaceletii TaxID=1206816 RepID=A0A495EC75_9FLAO|nr:Crp/Fnr family transcriptional regulator [Maribacter vaceletii]RKR14484.1 CRP-like cAMP-binding protein [Maribacter vaceletii]
MDAIRKSLDAISKLTDADWKIFSSKLKKHEIKKGDALLRAGDVERYLSFIVEGSARIYIPKIENDVTVGFVYENEFVSSYASFLTKETSTFQIEAMSATVLWRLTYTDLQDIYKETENGNTIGRVTAETLFLTKSKREESLLTQSAEERYTRLFKERPKLIKEIPLKYLASYIGVTPQALSRIRKRISR